MQGWLPRSKLLILGSFFAFTWQIPGPAADAAPASRETATAPRHTARVAPVEQRSSHARTTVNTRTYAGGGGISCVPFARNDSGISVSGNAWQWWGNAAGVYARGNVPEPGSVLTFRANGRMRLGHVAVVSRVHPTGPDTDTGREREQSPKHGRSSS